jgi:predicted PurR-regulated permease PerM
MVQELERLSSASIVDEHTQRGMLDLSLVKAVIALAATALGLYLCYRLSLPFLSALTWALVLAIILAPAHRQIEARVPRPNLSASLSVAAVAVAAGIPLFLMAQQLAREAASGALYLETALRAFDWRELIGNHPWLADATAWIEGRFDAANAVSALAQRLTEQSTSLFRGSVNQAVGLVLVFYMLFYLLRDRDAALHVLVAFSPLTTTETLRIADRFADTVRASIFGTVIIGLIQGTLGGLMFWWLALPTPVFWGLVMGMLAIIPMLGAFVVWLPAAVILALEGEWASAALLAVWGGGIIATVDNLLYPALVGSRLKLHTLPAFVGTVGGIILFGASGIVLGPAIIVVTLELIEILKQRSNSA